jgi:hypothetical protein
VVLAASVVLAAARRAVEHQVAVRQVALVLRELRPQRLLHRLRPQRRPPVCISKLFVSRGFALRGRVNSVRASP